MTPETLNQAFQFNMLSLEYLNFVSLLALMVWHMYMMKNYMELKRKYEELNLGGGR